MSTWQLQQAKQHLSEVVRAAEAGEPQVITKHGRKVAVVIEYEGYRAIAPRKRSFKEHLVAGPGFDDLELPGRPPETPREVEWA